MNTAVEGQAPFDESPGVLLPGCKVSAYDAGGGTSIEAALQLDGSLKWAVRHNGEVLAKTGQWEWEPFPSSRDEAFFKRCRFESPLEALDCLRHARLNA